MNKRFTIHKGLSCAAGTTATASIVIPVRCVVRAVNGLALPFVPVVGTSNWISLALSVGEPYQITQQQGIDFTNVLFAMTSQYAYAAGGSVPIGNNHYVSDIGVELLPSQRLVIFMATSTGGSTNYGEMTIYLERS